SDQWKFWPYHDRVFGSPPKAPQASDVVALAKESGLDVAVFESCLNATGTRDRLTAEIAEGQKARVDATPTLFINGKKLPRTNDFLQTVESEAARLGLPPMNAGAGGH